MLAFTKNAVGNFVITETSHGFIHTTTLTVEYSADLTRTRINKEPFRDTTAEEIAWFEKHYRTKFQKGSTT